MEQIKQMKQFNIGIITHYADSLNYGGLLQSYALQKVLSQNNFQSKQITYPLSCSVEEKNNQLKKAKSEKYSPKNIYNHFLHYTIKNYQNNKYGHIIKRKFIQRIKNADEFRMMIPHTNKCDLNTICKTNIEFNIFLTGSDQVWNPGGCSTPFFLKFVSDTTPKIAYAASIGQNSLTYKQLDFMIPLIKRLNYISVREEKAKDILQPYIDKEIKVALDPTLLLTQKDWDEISSNYPIKEPYIFVYLLGDNKAHRRIIKLLATNLGLKIVFIPHVHFSYCKNDVDFADIEIYDAGPAEFISLIKNAEMVISDSFHGCVFSIIYHKKFWALKRNKDSEKGNMNSRLYTLFKNTGIENPFLENNNVMEKEELLKEIDYEDVDKRLELLRKDSMDFLKDALEESVKKINDNQIKKRI